jgi:hypothetical protein
MGEDKPFSCKLYPLSYNPNNKSFYFDTDCPLMDPYLLGLKDERSDASKHFNSAQQVIFQLEKNDPAFLKNNHAVDKMYFDLKKIHSTANSNNKKTSKKSLQKKATT